MKEIKIFGMLITDYTTLCTQKRAAGSAAHYISLNCTNTLASEPEEFYP